jgi:hypothetical protein
MRQDCGLDALMSLLMVAPMALKYVCNSSRWALVNAPESDAPLLSLEVPRDDCACHESAGGSCSRWRAGGRDVCDDEPAWAAMAETIFIIYNRERNTGPIWSRDQPSMAGVILLTMNDFCD